MLVDRGWRGLGWGYGRSSGDWMRCWCGRWCAGRLLPGCGGRRGFGGGACAELGSIFVVGEVADVVECFDCPVVSDEVGEAFGSGLLGGQGGDAQGGDGGGETPAQVIDVAFDQERLMGVGEDPVGSGQDLDSAFLLVSVAAVMHG